MPKILVILIAGSLKQHKCSLPSLKSAFPGEKYDLLYVTRNFNYFPSTINLSSVCNILFENKCFPSHKHLVSVPLRHKSTAEIPHRAFGAYRFYCNKFYKNYDYIVCMSDDVYIRRHNWLTDIIKTFSKCKLIGVISNQVRNSPRHIRAPFFAIKAECLETIFDKQLWYFRDDHEAEMRFSQTISSAGYLAIQLGHGFDLATDYEWTDRKDQPRYEATPLPYHLLEDFFRGSHNERHIYSTTDIDRFEQCIGRPHEERLLKDFISTDKSPPTWPKDQRSTDVCWNIHYEFQPFHGLIANDTLQVAIEHDIPMQLYVGDSFAKICGALYEREIPSYFIDDVHLSYFGTNKYNPIAVLDY